MTEADAAELFVALSGAYPNSRVNELTAKMYREGIRDLDRDHAAKAVFRLIKTSKFMPTVAEIREAAIELQVGPKRHGAEAWGDVGLAIRHQGGRYGTPTFDDPLVAQCVESFGWIALCDSTNDTADRARFIELYDGLATKQRRELQAGEHLALPAASRQHLREVPGIGRIGTGGR